MKISTIDTQLGTKFFADYYHFGTPNDKCPMVIYVGGAISREEYQRRTNTEPFAILHEFEAAFKYSSVLTMQR
jgi:hypothetical protein